MTEYDVVLLPSFAQVEDWRKRKAREGREGLFSQTVSTFNAWIADLWELHGDGRAIVDTLQRATIMQAAFARIADDGETGDAPAGGEGLTVSPGVVKLAVQCVKQASGLPAFEHAVQDACAGVLPEGLAAREAALLRGIGCYVKLLEEAGLVELGQALAWLAGESDAVFPRPTSVLIANAAPLSWQMERFFASCSQVSVEVSEADGARGIGRMPEQVELRFGFPSGRYAQPALVMDVIRSFAAERGASEGATVVVACKDPLRLYKEIELELADAGIVGTVQAQVPFASVDFGRQFLSLVRVVEDDVWSKDDLSDAVRPPFGGFGETDAVEVDKELRANRLAERDDCLSQLRIASEAFSQLEELAGDPEADILLGVFEQMAFEAPARSASWRAEQLAAMSAVRSCTTAARSVGATMNACAEVLKDVKVSVSFENANLSAAGATRVVVTTQAVASQMGDRSCDLLLLADLTSEDFPIADKDDAAATLFGKLGFTPNDSALARARRTFTALQRVPASRLVCLRPLNDWDGGPTYPAAVLQELIDAYRVDATSDDDIDETFGLPFAFAEGVVQRGEENLYENAIASRVGTGQEIACEVLPSQEGDVGDGARNLVALPRRTADGQVLPGFSPSPSQVESYLECPRKWLVQNRLNVEGLDEGFGALERGSFAHTVLQRFYAQFAAEGQPKVTGENLQRAKELMRSIADEVEREQRLMQPGSGRYVAADQMEQRVLDACKQQLVSFLDFEVRFLPTFHPAYLEFSIVPEDGVTYAGHPFIGTVDRIDVDEAGNAVIVDYKGSVHGAHEIAGKGPDDPGKVQTRMYAQAVKRKLGLNVIGALYVSYGKKAACAGAFDGRALEAGHLPAMKVDHCSCAAESPSEPSAVEDYAQLSFADMLDETERLVGQAIDRMQEGLVHPDPVSPDVCQYCPVAYCSKRGA